MGHEAGLLSHLRNSLESAHANFHLLSVLPRPTGIRIDVEALHDDALGLADEIAAG
jgi:hypothetical protein